jgi:hypothetical protein
MATGALFLGGNAISWMWVILMGYLQPMLRIMHINLNQLPVCLDDVEFTHKDKFTVPLESILDKSVENIAEASLQRLLHSFWEVRTHLSMLAIYHTSTSNDLLVNITDP